MTKLIEDYALIGNNATAALVGNDGSIDWVGFPRFDSPACMAALLGSVDNGRWAIAPKAEHAVVKRRYREGTLVLETEFTTPEGTAVVIDCMDRRGDYQDILRVVKGVRGQVLMLLELVLRFDYGTVVPWVSRTEGERLHAIAGPERLSFQSPIDFYGEDMRTRASFSVAEGQELEFGLTWSPSFGPVPGPVKVSEMVERVTSSWKKWSARYREHGPHAEAVRRSLITLKALTHHKTGGIVAAATTSLPEEIGGVRNWDYRFCWLRDSTLTLYALLESGYTDEAREWRDWLIRSIAGDPDQMQIMYGVAGERRLTEFELQELEGYEGSAPVRIGNAASGQLQLDVYGEVLDSLYQGRRKGLPKLDAAWSLQKSLIGRLEKLWSKPDDGIWEVRGPRRHFTHSKVMAWVAVDRAVRTMEEFGEEGPVERWKRLRGEMHDEICRLGFSRDLNSFVQYFGSKELDASLLLLPHVGFLPISDERIQGTIIAIEKHLLRDGLVARYNTTSQVDALPGSEGTFLACSFWLVDTYMLQGRHQEARALFERLLSLRNDVGLLSEEYDPRERRMLGNFPQAFSHLALVNTAYNLDHPEGEAAKPVHHRSGHISRKNSMRKS